MLNIQVIMKNYAFVYLLVCQTNIHTLIAFIRSLYAVLFGNFMVSYKALIAQFLTAWKGSLKTKKKYLKIYVN